MRYFILLAWAALGLPLFAADYNKPRETADLFAKESALTYIIYSPEGEKREFTLGLGGQGAEKTFDMKGLKGSAALEKGLLRLTVNGRTFGLAPRVFAGGKLILWVQAQPSVRIVVPASFRSLEPALASALKAELDALDPFGGGYEEDGYAEEGE